MPEPTYARLHAIVYGFVQGVNFRANTQREAAHRNLTGWVRNRDDGTVETIAEGPRAVLDDFNRYLQHGPAMAEVDYVETSFSEATGEFSGFNIRY
jgi:acylphosphatase